jgi:hypothetical protein
LNNFAFAYMGHQNRHLHPSAAHRITLSYSGPAAQDVFSSAEHTIDFADPASSARGRLAGASTPILHSFDARETRDDLATAENSVDLYPSGSRVRNLFPGAATSLDPSDAAS